MSENTTYEQQEPEEITLEPNYGVITEQFIRDAMIHGGVLLRHPDPEILHLFRNFLTSLNISVQSAANAKSILLLRSKLMELTERVVKRDDKLQQGREEGADDGS